MTSFGHTVILEREECLRRLGHSPVARVAFTIGSRATVLPVNISVFGDDVIFRTRGGPKLDAAREAQTMTVEVDDFDPVTHTGWSVVVRGRARELRSVERARRMEEAPVSSWARPDAAHVVAIRADEVSGRTIGPGVATPQPEPEASGRVEPASRRLPPADPRPYAQTDPTS